MKKVLMIVIDALTSRVVVPAMENGDLPNFKALADAGHLNPNCISIFPSITHAATASLATGRYPREHGIAGSSWYKAGSDNPVYFTKDIWAILNLGLEQFFEDFVINLNHKWLQAETILQTVEQAGLKAACINHLIFRGNVKRTFDVPDLVSLLPGIPSDTEICGPSIFFLGDFIQVAPWDLSADKIEDGGLFERFGFEDDFTADVLGRMAQDDAFPDFTLAYFPNNDFKSHEIGPGPAVEMLKGLDSRLGELFGACGGLERMLQELCVVMTGDHAQSNVLSEESEVDIRLNDVFAKFSLTDAGEPWQSDDDLVAAPNLRMAQIYFKQPSPSKFERVVNQLLKDDRVDQVMWRAEFTETGPGYEVVTADRGKLRFWLAEDAGSEGAVDQQGNRWQWQGDLSVVDGQVSADNEVTFPDYPNAFERIKGGLECDSGGQLWVTAKPGYEFSLTDTSVHAEGGSHGSLHALDSVAPLFVAGAPEGLEIPPHPRIVDVAPLCLSALGLKK